MSLDLQQAAAVAGGHCWSERQLFELLGSWSKAVSEPAAVTALDRHSQHAAWRADQWWDRLPRLAGVERDLLVVAPGGVEAATSAGEAAASGAGVGLLALAYRVLVAGLATRYHRHRALTAPAADGPVRRLLSISAGDLGRDWVEGEAVLHAMLSDRDSARRAGEVVVAAEMAAAGAFVRYPLAP